MPRSRDLEMRSISRCTSVQLLLTYPEDEEHLAKNSIRWLGRRMVALSIQTWLSCPTECMCLIDKSIHGPSQS